MGEERQDYNLRMQFQKLGKTRFIGHLDLLRTFQRAIKRAALPAAYSQGFNPHMKLSFAMPLAIGATGCGEFMDLELSEKLPPDEVMARLNSALPEGIEIVRAGYTERIGQKAAAEVREGEYRVTVPLKDPVTPKLLEDMDALLKQEKIVVLKKTKKGEKEADIKPDICSVTWEAEDEETLVFQMCLATGSQNNLKPEAVLGAFGALNGFDPLSVTIHREKLTGSKGASLNV